MDVLHLLFWSASAVVEAVDNDLSSYARAHLQQVLATWMGARCGVLSIVLEVERDPILLEVSSVLSTLRWHFCQWLWLAAWLWRARAEILSAWIC